MSQEDSSSISAVEIIVASSSGIFRKSTQPSGISYTMREAQEELRMKLLRPFDKLLAVNIALAVLCLVPVVIMAQNQSGSAPAPATPLPWAYPLNPLPQPGAQAPVPDTAEHKLPGSSKAFTRKQATDIFNPPDWYPEDHPSMPEIVVHGRKPDVRACGYCHLPNGQGRT